MMVFACERTWLMSAPARVRVCVYVLVSGWGRGRRIDLSILMHYVLLQSLTGASG